MNRVAALHQLARAHHGLGRARGEGLGIPGPWGNVPGQAIAAGTYEISGTQVYLREQPSTSSADKGAFNATYGDNGGKVVGEPDQVDFDGQTGDQGGLRFASVTVKTGALAGKSGFVAMKYMAPVGWTASHGGTGSAPAAPPPVDQGGGGGGSTPPLAMTGDASEKWKPWLIGGIAALGAGGLLYLLFGTKTGKKARRRGKARRRLRRIRRGRKR